MRVPIPKGRGRPGKLWRQARRLERYPEVTDAELIAMACPRDAGDVGSTRRSRLQRVREALDYLVSTGYADCRPGQRLLPGPDWAGWEVANAKVSDGDSGDAFLCKSFITIAADVRDVAGCNLVCLTTT